MRLRILRLCNAISATLMLAAGCSAGASGPTSQPAHEPDWVQLTSGEWLKGRIRSMQQRDLEFDSDKLEELTLDWQDVKIVRSPKATCLFGDRDLYTGALEVDEKFVTVTSDGKVVKLPRSELNAISPGGLRERNFWSGNVDVGVNVRSGNTNQTDVTAQVNIKRRTPDTRLGFNYLGNYSTSSGSETTDNQRLGLSFDRNITRDFFVRPIGGQYYHDPPANIQNQGTISAGAGYYIFNQPHLEWEFFAGPAYQYTQFVDTEAGTSSENSTAAGVFQMHFDKKLTRRLDFTLDWQGILTGREAGLFTQHTVGTLEFEITHVLELNLSLIWDRTEHPQPNSSGHVPKRDDFQTVLSLGVRF
jgi:hypothetical protein